MKLDSSLTALNIKEGSVASHENTPDAATATTDVTEALTRARQEIKQLTSQLSEARREICLLKAERDFLREQNLGLRNQAVASKK